MSSGLTFIPNNQVLDEFIIERVHKRNEKKRHVIYTIFPQLRDIQTLVFWGIYSWSIPAIKQRWLKKDSVLRIDGLAASPGDVVRDYLDFYHPRKLRATSGEARIYDTPLTAPLYVKGFIGRQMSYVDITSTYFSILNNVGWNIGYKPGQWLTPGRAPLDFPLPYNKSARNYLVSIGLKSPLTVWTGSRLVQKFVYNAHINGALWRLVQDVLHSIANTAKCLGAVYIHTDGYILPNCNVPMLMDYIDSFHLVGRVLGEGDCYVIGPGNYRVGDKKTRNFDISRASGNWDNVVETDSRWLRNSIDKAVRSGASSRIYSRWDA